MQENKTPKWTRREFLRRSSAAALAAGMGAPVAEALAKAPSGEQAAKRPNILFIFSDQQRWDSLGCYGQPLKISPNLDRMAAEGVRFEHAFTCQPVCGPARAVVQTGKYASETGCYRNSIALPQEEKTLAEWLSEAGYEVGYIGKWHLAGGHAVQQAVPEEWRGGYKDLWLASNALEFSSHSYDGHVFDKDMKPVELKGYRVDALTNLAIQYLQTRDRQKPFFLFLSFLEPHFQNDHKHFEGPIGSKERFKNFKVPGDLVGTKGDWREEYPDYLGCCASLDENVGRLRAELKKLGLAGNTLIIYTSDHACHFRTRNSEYKRSCHEDSIRVPMIAYGPGFTGGKVIPEFASLIDVAPTVLAAAGIPRPKGMRGRPLQELASGKAKDWRQDIYVEISESEIGRAIRTKKWKYCVQSPEEGKGGKEPRSDVYVERYLYDLEKDPHERNNLVADPALKAVRAELARKLIAHIVEVEGKAPEIRPASV